MLLPGCLEMLGDVSIDPIGSETYGNQPGADCPDAGLAAGTCVIRCQPRQVRCDENLLQRCNDAGDGWLLLDQCASAALCDATSLSCAPPACAEREHRCTETGGLERCKADRTGFDLVEQCRSAAFCSAVPGRAQCEGTACRAGRQRCNGPQIEVCRADRSGYDVVGEPCMSAALCLEGPGDAAACTPPACAPGALACDGASLTRCTDEGTRFVVIDECATPALCDAEQRRCGEPACGVGDQRCTGSVLERCNAARDAYVPVQTCSSALLCDPAAAECLTTPPPGALPDPSVLNGPDYDFVDVTSPAVLGLGPMRLEVPEQWSDIDRSPWTDAAGTTLGPRFVASTDAARFAQNFDIPGVYFAATDRAPVEVAARQREFDLSTRCTAGSIDTYEDSLYRGRVQTWTNCGVTDATTRVIVALEKESSAFVTVVIVTVLAARDDEALDNVWDSFIAD